LSDFETVVLIAVVIANLLNGSDISGVILNGLSESCVIDLIRLSDLSGYCLWRQLPKKMRSSLPSPSG